MTHRVLPLSFAVLLAVPLAAQGRLEVGASALAYFLEWNTRAEGSSGSSLSSNTREFQGWFGGEARASFKAVSVAMRGLTGVLDDPLGQGEVGVRMTNLSVRFRPTGWLSVGPEAQALRYDRDGLVSLWRLYGGSVGVTGGLGIEGLLGRADVVSYLNSPPVAGDTLESIGRIEVGLTYSPPRIPLRLDVAYLIQDGLFVEDRRFEGFRGVLLGVGLQLGR